MFKEIIVIGIPGAERELERRRKAFPGHVHTVAFNGGSSFTVNTTTVDGFVQSCKQQALKDAPVFIPTQVIP